MKFLLPRLLVLIVTCLPAARAAEASNLPAPELTEYWEPVPPVVQAPAGGAPSDAIVLFDGTNLDAWEPSQPRDRLWRLEDGAVVVVPEKYSPEEAATIALSQPPGKWSGLRTKKGFGDVQLHLEFRTPVVVKGSGQGRGNSGIFLMDRYEVQVLDSWENKTYVNGQLGSIYKQFAPLVNPARPPGEWQTFDIIFFAPRFAANGTVVEPARMTVLLNGILVQYDSVLEGPTEWRGAPKYSPHSAKEPITLQNHGDLVAYRNIWVREVSRPETK